MTSPGSYPSCQVLHVMYPKIRDWDANIPCYGTIRQWPGFERVSESAALTYKYTGTYSLHIHSRVPPFTQRFCQVMVRQEVVHNMLQVASTVVPPVVVRFQKRPLRQVLEQVGVPWRKAAPSQCRTPPFLVGMNPVPLTLPRVVMLHGHPPVEREVGAEYASLYIGIELVLEKRQFVMQKRGSSERSGL